MSPEKIGPRIFAGLFIGTGVLAAAMSYRLAEFRKYDPFVTEFIKKNADRIDEFDLIWLREMGIDPTK